MLTNARFTKEHRCFKEGDFLEFRPGVNLLVGDQGVGKSSLLEGIMGVAKLRLTIIDIDYLEVGYDVPTDLLAFDFEKNNPRMVRSFDDAPIAVILYSKFHSHGESVNAMLEKLASEKEPKTFLMDEPDMALSIRSVRKLANLLKEAEKAGHQFLCSVHNPYLILEFPEVLSLEHRRWIPSQEFVDSQLG